MLACGLGLCLDLGETYRDADQVDSHEKEVDLGSDPVDAYWPYLGYENRADRATGGSEVESASANGGREDL